jgi:hypothetical protein
MGRFMSGKKTKRASKKSADELRVNTLVDMLNSRLPKITFNTKNAVNFISQSMMRFNALGGFDYRFDNLPYNFSEIIVRGAKLLCIEELVTQKIAALHKEEDATAISVLLTLLTNMEQFYLQEVQAISSDGEQ